MFPIPFNFPFRKKDGSLTSLGKAIEDGGGSYTLPTASAEIKGGVKVGAGLTMDGETLKNLNPTPYALPAASDETLGGVKVGTGLEIDENGVLSTSGGSGSSLHLYYVTTNQAIAQKMWILTQYNETINNLDTLKTALTNGIGFIVSGRMQGEANAGTPIIAKVPTNDNIIRVYSTAIEPQSQEAFILGNISSTTANITGVKVF